MLTTRPGEREWVSWLWVSLWVLAIFAVVPVARVLQELMSDRFGRQIFGYLTLAMMAIAVVSMVRYLARRRPSPARYLWLALVSAIYIGYTAYLWEQPEEALHLVQYGVLGVLTYRALCHRVSDASIYLVASIIGAIVGMLDEILQWLTPGRFWGLRDIWIDCVGTVLAQLAIALGLKPTIIAWPPRPASIKRLWRWTVPLLLVVAATLMIRRGGG